MAMLRRTRCSGRASDRSIQLLDAALSYPLGIDNTETLREAAVQLEPGDMLVLCTDGVTEAESEMKQEYGLDRLAASAQRNRTSAANTLVNGCLAELDAWRGARKAQDDVTVMILRRPSA